MKDTHGLLADIKWLDILQVYYLGQINERLSNMATAEQVAALKTAIDAVEATLLDEINEVQAAIEAAKSNEPDPALDAEIGRLTALKDRIEGIVTAVGPPAPEPAPEP